MHVRLKLFANLARYAPDAKSGEAVEVEVPEEATVADLLAEIAMPPGKARIIFVNGRTRPPETELAEGDQVGVFPPIGGG